MISMNIKDDDSSYKTVDYSCCPTIYLSGEQTEALGITGMPAPGTVLMLKVRAVVKRVTASAEEPDEVAAEGNKPDLDLTLECTDMEVVSGGKDTATMLYGD